MKIIFPQFLRHCWFLAPRTAILKFEAILNPDPFSTYDCSLFLEACRLLFVLGVLKFHNDVPLCGSIIHYGGHSVDPFDLETSLYEFWETILLMIFFPQLSLFSPWNSHYLEIGPPGLSLNVILFSTIFIFLSLYFLRDFLSTVSSKLLSLTFLLFLFSKRSSFCLFAIGGFLLKPASCPYFTVTLSSISGEIKNKVSVVAVACFGLIRAFHGNLVLLDRVLICKSGRMQS